MGCCFVFWAQIRMFLTSLNVAPLQALPAQPLLCPASATIPLHSIIRCGLLLCDGYFPCSLILRAKESHKKHPPIYILAHYSHWSLLPRQHHNIHLIGKLSRLRQGRHCETPPHWLWLITRHGYSKHSQLSGSSQLCCLTDAASQTTVIAEPSSA